jgi:hypothetical protein
MTTTTSRQIKAGATTDRDDAPFDTRFADSIVSLGIDAHGDEHVLSRATGTVHQIAHDGRRVETHALTDRPEPAPIALDIYVHDFVGGVRGWARRTKATDRDVWGEENR